MIFWRNQFFGDVQAMTLSLVRPYKQQNFKNHLKKMF